MKKLFTILLAFVIMIGALTGCGTGNNKTSESGEKNYEGLVIHLGHFTTCAYPYVEHAILSGLLEDEFSEDGITFEYSDVTSGADAITAMTTGDLDFCTVGDQPISNALANDSKITLLFINHSTEEGNSLVVLPESDITGIEQLEGKTIGCGIGTAAYRVVLEMLDNAGIPSDRVDFVNIQGTEGLAALQKGDLDALFSSDPQRIAWEDAGAAVTLANAEGITQCAAMAVSDQFKNKYPELVTRITKVFLKSYQEVEENTDEVYQNIAEAYDLDLDLFHVWIARFDVRPRTDEEDFQAIQDTADFLYENGYMTKEVDIDSAVDTSYFEEAEKLLKE